ncbi:UDP-3-O-acyl-N-acetylglucosamine deacetylase [Aquamicrobium segne]|uniref:UDP-3-O-acyl-N-acetylglucosamine deacetylase n=1 Tax=Aquamicrobium segne TaxID=469547 RepID=A0ABW0H4C7_9HYPH
MDDYQTTIKSRVRLTGTGVHSGKPVAVTFVPSDVDTGIVFQFVDGPEPGREIRALVSEVGATDLSTLLGNPTGVHVSTVEHLMAALLGAGIDNLIIEMEGNEVPILDGSAAMFVEAIDQVGLEVQSAKRRFIRILKEIRIENGASWAEFRPYSGTRFEVGIDFESRAIGRQQFDIDLNGDSFRTEIAGSRTFGFLKDVERLWAGGYALGSSLENSVVIGYDNKVINMEGLRFSDEFVRHKTLDAIGDLALAGARFIGCFRSYRGGHRLNSVALRRLLSDPEAFEIVETTRQKHGRIAQISAVSGPVFAPWAI